MAVLRRKTDYRRLSEGELETFASIPTAILSDVMNRARAMTADIKSLTRGLRFAGHARTVEAMVADSSVVHAAVATAEPGDVLVMNVGGYVDRASWGGIATRTAMSRNVRAVVFDGAARDVMEIRELRFPVWCRGVVPLGPHKGHGGTIDTVVSVGGVAVSPGDIVIGDDDGVAVVPLSRAARVKEDAMQQIAREKAWLRDLDSGKTMADILSIAVEEMDTE